MNGNYRNLPSEVEDMGLNTRLLITIESNEQQKDYFTIDQLTRAPSNAMKSTFMTSIAMEHNKIICVNEYLFERAQETTIENTVSVKEHQRVQRTIKTSKRF
jgi:hypothetical protein